jgi:hypothetical protein
MAEWKYNLRHAKGITVIFTSFESGQEHMKP